MKWNARHVLGRGLCGGLFGLALDDTLKALGLHWLAWPIVGLLTLFVLVGSYIVYGRS